MDLPTIQFENPQKYTRFKSKNTSLTSLFHFMQTKFMDLFFSPPARVYLCPLHLRDSNNKYNDQIAGRNFTENKFVETMKCKRM